MTGLASSKQEKVNLGLRSILNFCKLFSACSFAWTAFLETTTYMENQQLEKFLLKTPETLAYF